MPGSAARAGMRAQETAVLKWVHSPVSSFLLLVVCATLTLTAVLLSAVSQIGRAHV